LLEAPGDHRLGLLGELLAVDLALLELSQEGGELVLILFLDELELAGEALGFEQGRGVILDGFPEAVEGRDQPEVLAGLVEPGCVEDVFGGEAELGEGGVQAKVLLSQRQSLPWRKRCTVTR